MNFKSNIKKIFASLCYSVFLLGLTKVSALEVNTFVTASTTVEEMEAVNDYKEFGYEKINKELRKEKKPKESEELKKATKISSFINKNNLSRTSRPEHLYRGISREALRKMLTGEKGIIDLESQITKGAILTEKGFMSTSSDFYTADNFSDDGIMLVIKRCEDDCNCKCAYLGSVECEYLFDYGQKLLVTDVKNNFCKYVYCKIIHE